MNASSRIVAAAAASSRRITTAISSSTPFPAAAAQEETQLMLKSETDTAAFTIATRELTVETSDDASFSHSSVYSDDESDEDSAALYAEDDDNDDDASKLNNEEPVDDWLDEDIHRSSRLIYNIMCLLIGSSLIVAIVTLHFANQQARDEYELALEDLSNDIFDVVQARSENVANVIRSMSRTITTVAATSPGGAVDWPFFTLDNLEQVAEDFMAFDPQQAELVYSPVVTEDERQEWEEYSVQNQDKVKQSTDYPYRIPHYIYSRQNGTVVVVDDDNDNGTTSVIMGPYSPVWQMIPPPNDFQTTSRVNYNLLSNAKVSDLLEASYYYYSSDSSSGSGSSSLVVSDLAYQDQLYGLSLFENDVVRYPRPRSIHVQPVYQDFESSSSSQTTPVVVAHLLGTLPWEIYMEDTIAHPRDQVFCVIENSCGNLAYTYVLSGGGGGGDASVEYLGAGDLHTSKYDEFQQQLLLSSYGTDLWHCNVTLTVYPTGAMQWRYESNSAVTHLLALVFFVFILVGISIMTHHRVTDAHLRDTKVQGQRSKAIIASLFPEALREKLFDVEGEVNVDKLGLLNSEAQKAIKTDDDDGTGGGGGVEDLWGKRDKYADMYPNCTVCIADICGFSAWSSSRDPSEVFTLLEAVFNAFDKIARLRGVYKVETLGDSYTCAAGLPNPRDDHALVMAKFARDALNDFIELCNKLEISLGPDTSDLGIRFGLASGPILAGVLRGLRARFQVYGSTVSKCAKLQETGLQDRIHIAEETAKLIKAKGFGSWVRARHGPTTNGTSQTYWLLPKRAVRSAGSTRNLMLDCSNTSHFHNSTQSFLHASSIDNSAQTHARPMPFNLSPIVTNAPLTDNSSQTFQTRRSARARRRSSLKLVPAARKSQTSVEKVERLVFWSSEIFLRALRRIEAKRVASRKIRLLRDEMAKLEDQIGDTGSVLREVYDPIQIASHDFDSTGVNVSSIELGAKVESQLLNYITTISGLYKKTNSFSNFEHASHITMHTQKLLMRLVSNESTREVISHGFRTDPLIHFAVLLSALISDVDHRGVSNHDLSRENTYMAELYNHQSISEQNSLAMAWQALMDHEFQDLRRCIYSDEEELRRFRSVLVHGVLATDINNTELNEMRQQRWDKAFRLPDEETSSGELINLKATAVVEILMQVATLSHSMQHWHVYCKWSQSDFFEQVTAFREGRAEKDPGLGWYTKELALFESKVIPLAKKLRDSGVLGDAGAEEYLNNALSNKKEWEAMGEDLVNLMTQKYNSQAPLRHGVRRHDSGSGDEGYQRRGGDSKSTAESFEISHRRR